MNEPITYQVGTLADVTLRARITEVDGSTIVIETDVMDQICIWLTDPAVTLTVVAPPEWPPIQNDVWVDRNGSPWLVAEDEDDQLLDSSGSHSRDRDFVLREYGPLRLVYRKPAGGAS